MVAIRALARRLAALPQVREHLRVRGRQLPAHLLGVPRLAARLPGARADRLAAKLELVPEAWAEPAAELLDPRVLRWWVRAILQRTS